MLSKLSIYNLTLTGLLRVILFTTGQLHIAVKDTLDAVLTADGSLNITPVLTLEPLESALAFSYVSSVNQVLPSAKGSLFLLGDKCISFSPEKANLLYMFDGCYSCDSCQKLWLIQLALHETGNLISILKDCQLYLSGTVEAFVAQMQLLNALFRSEAPLCVYKSLLLDQAKTYKAVKLLYLYRALVAMWNYLAQKTKSRVLITLAPLLYSGFTVQAKQAFDLCTNAGADNTVELKVHITLLAGQTKLHLLLFGLCMGCYVLRIPLDTYITEGLDIDMYSTPNSLLLPIVLYESADCLDHIVKFTYKPLIAAQTVVSAGVKLLPVVIKDKQCPSRLTLLLFTAYRKPLSLFNVLNQLKLNIWRVLLHWKYYNTQQKLVLLTETRLYTTSFTRTPI